MRDPIWIERFCHRLHGLELDYVDDHNSSWKGIPLFAKHNIQPDARQLWLKAAEEVFECREKERGGGLTMMALAQALGGKLQYPEKKHDDFYYDRSYRDYDHGDYGYDDRFFRDVSRMWH